MERGKDLAQYIDISVMDARIEAQQEDALGCALSP